MGLKLNGATSGSIEIDVPAVAGTDTAITIPATTGGEFIVSDSSGNIDLGPLDINGGASDDSVNIDGSGRLLVGTNSALSSGNSQYAKIQTLGNTAGATGNARVVIGRGEAATDMSSGNSIGEVNFTDNTSAEFAQIQAFVDGTPGTNDYPGRLVFSTTASSSSSPTERMRITKEGNIYFGNAISSTPWNKSSGNSTMSWIEDNGSNFGTLAIANNADRTFSAVYVNKFAYTSGDDNRYIDFRLNGAGSSVGTVTINATSNGVNYNTSSDYRLKENVVPLTGGIDRLKQLNVNRFNFISNPDCTVDGFIAHEVQAVVPEAITGEKDAVDNEGNPRYQGIDQSKLVPLLTAALQEAIAKIETLEAKVAALEGGAA